MSTKSEVEYIFWRRRNPDVENFTTIKDLFDCKPRNPVSTGCFHKLIFQNKVEVANEAKNTKT